MCGIFGAFDRQQRPLGENFAELGCQRMAHRGPDDQGYFEADGVLIGNRRLSILDPAGGHQPMFSEDGQIAVVQNGEIYNFVELSRGLNCSTTCDTEVILRLYERDGEDFVHRLNGMFAIAIFDRRRQKLMLFRDRVGEKPLYLHDDGTRLVFASEIKSILAVGVPAEPNLAALDAYLTYNFVPPPITLFRGIRHLPPGHMLSIDRRGTVIEREWWNFADNAVEQRSESDWCDRLIETLGDATQLRLRSDVPLGAFLSGGIDSSSVVALMAGRLPHPVQTFCIGFDDPRFDESKYAREVAERFGTHHTCEIVQADMTSLWPLATWHSDQPHGDVSFLPTYCVSRMARQHVKVVMTGDGGDELFAGYDVHKRFFSSPRDHLAQADFEREYVRAISLFTPEEKRNLYSSAAKEALCGVDSFALAEHHMQPLRHWDRINQVLGLDVKLLLPGNNLVKPDKMAMAVSLEPRAPFLDVRMIELAFRIPGALKLKDGTTKWIFKRAAERLLSSKIVHRKKQMFSVPIGEWFKTTLLPFVRDVLLSKATTQRGLFDTARVTQMIEQHAAGTENYTRHLRALISLELWQRMFVDASFDHAPTFEELGLKTPAAAPPVFTKRAA